VGIEGLRGGLVHIVQVYYIFLFSKIDEQHHRHNLILISSIYPIQGGGDYRGIYDKSLKRGDYRGIYDISLKRGFYGVYRPFIECPLQDR
jgi:hypothetical protein